MGVVMKHTKGVIWHGMNLAPYIGVGSKYRCIPVADDDIDWFMTTNGAGSVVVDDVFGGVRFFVFILKSDAGEMLVFMVGETESEELKVILTHEGCPRYDFMMLPTWRAHINGPGGFMPFFDYDYNVGK